VTAHERQTYQEQFIDLCRLMGHQTLKEYDPTGTRFGFKVGQPRPVVGRAVR
jgi:hypothetical protein